MDTINVKVVQKKPFDAYTVGSCDTGNCYEEQKNACDWNVYSDGVEIKDWNYKSSPCMNECKDLIYCSKINSKICPQIGYEVISRWDIEPPNIQCTYPLDTFLDMNNIQKYIDILGEDDNYNNYIMPQFCSQIVETCPENVHQTRFTQCSRMVSNGVDGERCRQWSAKNPKVSDKTILTYCNQNNTEDCSCISENQEDVCELNTCMKPSYLSTSEIRKQVEDCTSRQTKPKLNIQNSSQKSSRWLPVICILLFLFVILIVCGTFGYKTYGKQIFRFS